MTPLPRAPLPQSSPRERSPPRTALGPHATPPSAFPATGSGLDRAALPVAAPASSPPLHTSTIEVLRRPIEFALRPAVGVNHDGAVRLAAGDGRAERHHAEL